MPLPHEQLEPGFTTGADAVIASLVDHGVKHVFGYPGGAIMPIYDALHRAEEGPRHVLSRHEQGAVHAAQGYARVSGQPGVCFATSGPGATNLITGLADAKIDSTPLVCITGQVASHLLGKDAFQEVDVRGLTAPVTKWNCLVTQASDIPRALAQAFHVATTGRPGPVLVDITKDAQLAPTPTATAEVDAALRGYHTETSVDCEALDAAAALLNRARRPYILVGQGALLSGAHREVIQLAERLDCPVASTLLGLSAIPTTHPLYAGMLGMHGRYGANLLTEHCDVLFAVGMRFDDRVTGDTKRFATQAKIIHLDIDRAEIGRHLPTCVAIQADARQALRALLPKLESGQRPHWRTAFRAFDAVEHRRVVKQDLYPQSGALRMGEVVRHLNEELHGEAVLVTDVGQHQMSVARYARYERPHSSVSSGGLGTMGFALPAAIGAKLASPEREVVAVIGDGGFQMTLQELGTLAANGVDLKVVILNNAFLGMVRQWQEIFFESRYASTELSNPDFVKIAEGYGLAAATVEHREDLKHALKTMMDTPGPYILEVRVMKEENVYPMVPSGGSVTEIRLGEER